MKIEVCISPLWSHHGALSQFFYITWGLCTQYLHKISFHLQIWCFFLFYSIFFKACCPCTRVKLTRQTEQKHKNTPEGFSLFHQLPWKTIKVFISKVLCGIFWLSVGLNSNEWWKKTHRSSGTFTAPPICLRCPLFKSDRLFGKQFACHPVPLSLHLQLLYSCSWRQTAEWWSGSVKRQESGGECEWSHQRFCFVQG